MSTKVISTAKDAWKTYNQKKAIDKKEAENDAYDQPADKISFHDRVSNDFKKDPEPYQNYTKTVKAGLERARDIQNAYRNHNHKEHSFAQQVYNEHGHDFELIQNTYVNKLVNLAGAKKLESKNTAYESKVLDCIKGAPSNADDAGMAAKARATIKQKWFDRGYEIPEDSSVMQNFLNDNHLSTGADCVNRIKQVTDAYFGQARQKTMNDVLTGNSVSDRMKKLRNDDIEANAKRDANRRAEKLKK